MNNVLQLYKRVPKTVACPRGSTKVEKNEFIAEGPVLLCVSAQDDPKSVFGITKFGMNVAGLRIREENHEGYDLEDFPATFCSIRKEIVEKERRKSSK